MFSKISVVIRKNSHEVIRVMTNHCKCSKRPPLLSIQVGQVLPPVGLTLLKISKNDETSGLLSLDTRLQMCAINFPLSLHSEP
jgi:hypothetical protein